jgi:DNA (cytosine-5)-methyltransferase 1
VKNEIKTMHLFAGIGGGLLADLILGHTPVVAVEWEPYACKVLRERATDGWFPGLQVWEGDVRLFDPSEYTGVVDCIHAGFPCQDISVAGKQAGVSEGTRSGLYREVLRIAGVVRPKQLFLENVSAILSNGLGTVLGDLAALGYDCRWLCIRASDVGAPHHRDRWFLLADAKCSSTIEQPESAMQRGRTHEAKQVGVGNIYVSNADSLNSGDKWKEEVQGNGRMDQWQAESNDDGIEEYVADANNQRREELNTPGIAAIPGWDGGCTDAGWCASWWATEPELGRVAHGVPNRVGQLKGYGNAQVPLQAAAAYRLLGGF